MTESVSEAQGLTGRTRVTITLISSVVTVALALITAGYLPSGSREVSAAPKVAVSPSEAVVASPAQWKIAGYVEPAEGQGAMDIALHLVPFDGTEWVQPDDQGYFVFNVPPGPYTLLVKSLDDSDARDIKVTVDKSIHEPVKSFVFPAPLNVVTITEQ